MDRYELREHYQKRMDVIADRFQKQVGITVLLFTGLVWSIFNTDIALKPHLTYVGYAVLAAIFVTILPARNSAAKAARAVQAAFENDYRIQFNEAPDQKLTGLFP